MKKSNIIILYKLIIILLNNIFLQSVFSLNNPELYIKNLSSDRVVSIKIYPVSMTFNGFKNYDLLCAFREDPPNYNFINANYGGSLNPNDEFIYNHEFNTANNGNHGSIGFGIYKVLIRWGTSLSSFDTCTIEWDYGWAIAPPPFTADLSIFFRDNNNDPRITFQWSSGTELRIDTSFVNKKIEAWKQYGIGIREKNFGNFQYIQQNIQATFPPERDYNYYILFPQDSRRDCERTLFKPDGSTYFTAENQNFDENRSGDLSLNLTIDKKVYTPDIYQMKDFPTLVNIKSKVVLKLNDNDTIDFTYVNSTEDPLAYFEMNVESNGRLLLNTNSRIILRNKNKLNLITNSFLHLGSNAEIIVKPGALLCNYGASIRGSGRIFYEGSLHQSICNQLSDYLMQDSVKFILDSNAVLPIPYNSTLNFRGNEYAESGFLLDNVNGKSKYNVVSEFSIKFYINIKS